MKRFLVAVLLIASLTALCSCSDEKTDDVSVPSDTAVPVEAVAENDDVFINIKKELVDIESFVAQLESYDIVCSEGETFLTLTMDSETYTTLVEDKNNLAISKFNTMLLEEGTYIEKLDYDENFRDIDVYVNRSVYDSEERNSYVVSYTVGAPAMAYQLFLPNGMQTTVRLIYSDTEEVISTYTLPYNATLEQ